MWLTKVTCALALLNAVWDYKVIKKQFYEHLSVQIQKQNASTLSRFERGWVEKRLWNSVKQAILLNKSSQENIFNQFLLF